VRQPDNPVGGVSQVYAYGGLATATVEACYSRAPAEERQTGPKRGPMPSPKIVPPAPVGFLQLRVRSVEGPLVSLALLATDHRIVLGQDCDYLIGNGIAHVFSKEGLFIRSGAVPAILQDLHTLGGATRVEQASAG
jgi:hypothetical protein